MFRRFFHLPALHWILLGALILRVGAAFAVQKWVESVPGRLCLVAGDAEGYWELGRHLARGEDYSLYDPPRHVMRMPGFPLFLAAIMKPFGEQVLLTRILLACVGTAACGLVYWLGRELVDRETGQVAALLAALSPTLAGFSVLLLSETLFALALLASLIAFARFMRSTSPGQLLGCATLTGLLCGAATLVRPTWFLVGPTFAAAGLLRRADWRYRIPGAVLVLAAFAAVLAPWTIRNAHVTGHFVPTTLWAGPSLYDGLSPQAARAQTGASDMRFIESDGIYGNASISEYDADEYYRRAALDFVRTHPGRAAVLAAIKLFRFWNPFPNAEQFANLAIRLGVGVYELPVLLLACVGAWLSRKNLLLLSLTSGPIVYFALVHAVFVGSLRYRLPAEYALLVLTAIGCRWIPDLWCRRLACPVAGQTPAPQSPIVQSLRPAPQ